MGVHPIKSMPKLFSCTGRVVALTSKFVLERVSLHKKHLLRGILVGLTISIAVTILAWLGHFRYYERPLGDFFQLLIHKKARDVALLFITEKEYKQGFRRTSPLSRSRLADTIDTLVKLKAKVIALDIDLSDPTHEDQKLANAIDRATNKGVPIIVPGNLKGIEEKTPLNESQLIDSLPYMRENVLHTEKGFQLFENADPGKQWVGKIMYGGVTFRLDPDGTFRQAEALYMVRRNDSEGNSFHYPIPSLPVAVAAASCGLSQQELLEALSNIRDHTIILSGKKARQGPIKIHIGKGGKIIPNFVGDYQYFAREINLTRLLEDYGHGKPEGMTIFKDKVVIIGGSYDEKDFYRTPVGRISGLEIMANITQNIMSGNLITHVNFYKAFAIEVLIGAIVAMIFIFASRFWATIICFVIMIPLVVAASFLSFSNSYYWFDFVPTIIGVMVHGRIHKATKNVE